MEVVISKDDQADRLQRAEATHAATNDSPVETSTVSLRSGSYEDIPLAVQP